MGDVVFPSPDNLGRAPAWENYVAAQAVQASLGEIPRDAVAVGVRVSGLDVELCFQVSRVTEESDADVEEIENELQIIVGNDINITHSYEIRDRPLFVTDSDVWWIYRARRIDSTD